MTRCSEFYDKVKKDGNFCGMRKDKFAKLLEYIKYRDVEEMKNPKGVLSEGAWFKQHKKTAETNKSKTKKARQTKATKNQPEEDLKVLAQKTKDLDTTPPITYAREFVEWMLEHEKAELDTIINLVSQAVSNIKELEKQNE